MRREFIIPAALLAVAVSIGAWSRRTVPPPVATETYSTVDTTIPVSEAALDAAPVTPVAYVTRRPARKYRAAPRRRYVRRYRSTRKSAAIVAGSAGAGAAIGGIAGGGKGAALGAVTGGTAGFVYDRLTRKKKIRR